MGIPTYRWGPLVSSAPSSGYGPSRHSRDGRSNPTPYWIRERTNESSLTKWGDDIGDNLAMGVEGAGSQLVSVIAGHGVSSSSFHAGLPALAPYTPVAVKLGTRRPSFSCPRRGLGHPSRILDFRGDWSPEEPTGWWQGHRGC